MLFRVENEHCNNVGRFRASRDIPLPYSIPESHKESEETPRPSDEQAPAPGPADMERTPETISSSLRLRRTMTSAATPVERAMRRAGTIIGTAHAQDYQKKKRPGVVGDSPHMGAGGGGNDDSDEEDDGEASDGQISSNDEELMEVQKVLRRGQHK